MSEVIAHHGGLYTTVQDAGRHGHYAIGMPPSGAMDQYSYAVANLLVGNHGGEAALEATYVGPRLELTDDRLVAVTGARVSPTLSGEPVAPWTTLRARAGDVLGFGTIEAGARFYIAVRGGIDVPRYLGSRSTYMLTGVGGLEGRRLADGDRLPLGPPDTEGPRPGATVSDDLLPAFPEVAELRTVVGLCSYRLTEAAMAEFLEVTWRVTKDADRVGYRLRGGSLGFVERRQPFGAGSDPANVVDLGYPIGSVQVPGGDEPIVLLNDAVTGGGYATIGTVISVDRDRIAQARMGDPVSFVPVDLETALHARRDRTQRIERVRAGLRGVRT